MRHHPSQTCRRGYDAAAPPIRAPACHRHIVRATEGRFVRRAESGDCRPREGPVAPQRAGGCRGRPDRRRFLPGQLCQSQRRVPGAPWGVPPAPPAPTDRSPTAHGAAHACSGSEPPPAGEPMSPALSLLPRLPLLARRARQVAGRRGALTPWTRPLAGMRHEATSRAVHAALAGTRRPVLPRHCRGLSSALAPDTRGLLTVGHALGRPLLAPRARPARLISPHVATSWAIGTQGCRATHRAHALPRWHAAAGGRRARSAWSRRAVQA